MFYLVFSQGFVGANENSFCGNYIPITTNPGGTRSETRSHEKYREMVGSVRLRREVGETQTNPTLPNPRKQPISSQAVHGCHQGRFARGPATEAKCFHPKTN